MGYSSFRDTMRLWGASFGSNATKYFSRNIDSVKITAAVEKCSVVLPEFTEEGIYQCDAKYNRIDLNPIIHLLQWKGDNLPVIIYHNYLEEKPADKGARKIFLDPANPLNANIILIEAALTGSQFELTDMMVDLDKYIAVCAASVQVIEMLVQKYKKNSPKVVVCGTSFGGWVANLHYAVYTSATVYIPVMAGSGMGNYFFDSPLKKRIGKKARLEADKVRRMLNFEDQFMAAGNHHNVHPLLARDDQFVRFNVQMTSYGDIPVAVMPKGHVTGLKAYKHIRRHIVASLDKRK